MLPAVLLGELLAGVALGAAWPRLTTPPGAQSQLLPTTAVLAPAVVPGAPGAVPPVLAPVPAAPVAPVAVAPVPVSAVAVAPVGAPVPVAVPVTAPVPGAAPAAALAPGVPAPVHAPDVPAARNPFFVLVR